MPGPGSSGPRYGIALLGIIAVILLSAGSGDDNPFGALALLVEGAVLVFVVRISETDRRWIRIAAVVATVFVILGVVSIALSDYGATVSSEIVGALFAIVTPLVIARRLIHEGRITGPVVAGALCIYLMIGLFYVQVYGLVDRFSDEPFFVQTSDPSPVDFTYFSYVTMTTTGYGDFTAASGFSRMLAVTEALFGQLYLVTVVGLAVSRVRRPGAVPTDAGLADAVAEELGEEPPSGGRIDG